ncbi:hypothetical protein TVNIR_0456 [Thioalkalivibrio nitratireducens DSM 14787]|uniref:Uncharacterized protein n=1 Tax=Thioalkalivibrio nitratireducens (strain DSM 14787 / UNIQEM 213 / ALEN2) TaxID=1255043 RepID=L0DT23_THIND|nr:hypothetical protein TVNIR_0456 [Thioalkalivibrio nitratireducens DSM 14787]
MVVAFLGSRGGWPCRQQQEQKQQAIKACQRQVHARAGLGHGRSS